ncbi:hypothetical protein [Pseudarthrobacter sp. TAF60_1]|uniref:hypothetical protein n=1 Tax=Pseudarthrobacter sp. TAF60_1 TaxID=3233071 RepID=UPI003F958D84
MAGNPLRALGFQRLDLVLGGAVKFLAGDVLIDLRRPFAVGTVGAAKITRIGNTGRTIFGAVPPELAGTGVTAVETAGCTVLAVAKRLAIVTATEPTPITFTLAARTITKRLAVAVTERFTVALPATEPTAITLTFAARTITKRLAVAVTERFAVALPAAEPTAITFALAPRTITKRLAVAVTVRLPLSTTAERLLLSPTEAAAITFALAARTITKRLAVAVTVRLPLSTTAERLPLSPTEAAAITFALAARTITKRLITLAIGLAVTRPGRTLRRLGIPVIT